MAVGDPGLMTFFFRLVSLKVIIVLLFWARDVEVAGRSEMIRVILGNMPPTVFDAAEKESAVSATRKGNNMINAVISPKHWRTGTLFIRQSSMTRRGWHASFATLIADFVLITIEMIRTKILQKRKTSVHPSAWNSTAENSRAASSSALVVTTFSI